MMAIPASIIKSKIISNTIESDQNQVAMQWFNTFKYNLHTDVATSMAKMLLACVAKGDFKVKSKFIGNEELANPYDILTAVDYISHASRIIIDYDELSDENKVELLEYFPLPQEKINSVFARSATHAVLRKDKKIKELKGLKQGLICKDNYGLNIAMGGEDQDNFVGNKISNNGYSGHMYFFRKDESDNLLMAGLEQSAPAESLTSVVVGFLAGLTPWGSINTDGCQHGTDQFEQSHSLTGGSDTYTAAGSLYFSDPVYQAKLLQETGTTPPDKYDAMHVKLTNENWQNVKLYIETLNKNLTKNNVQYVTAQFLQKPCTAVEKKDKVQSYIAIDFKIYLERISTLLETPDLNQKLDLEKHKKLRKEFLTLITTLKAGDKSVLPKLRESIKEITQDEFLPKSYVIAINRIEELFDRQLTIDPDYFMGR